MFLVKPFKYVLAVFAVIFLSALSKLAYDVYFAHRKAVDPVTVENKILIGTCNGPPTRCHEYAMNEAQQEELKRTLEAELAWEPFKDNDVEDWLQPIQILAIVNGEPRAFRCRYKKIFEPKTKLSWHAPQTTAAADKIWGRIATDLARDSMKDSKNKPKE